MKKHKIIGWLVLSSIIIAILSLVFAYRAILVKGSMDLRTRTVGTRLALKGENPYFFKWQNGMREELIDPLVDPEAIGLRLTVPPTVLLILAPIAGLPFGTQIILWFFFEWIALFALSLFLSSREQKWHTKTFVFLCLIISVSHIWLMHVRIGQIYIFYTLIFTLSYWLSTKNKNKYGEFISGLILGFLGALRPTFFLIAILFGLQKKWNHILGQATGALLLIVSSALVFGVDIWKYYINAMLHVSSTPVNTLVRSLNPEMYYPKVIEGLTFLAKDSRYFGTNSSIKALYFALFETKMPTLLLGIFFVIFLLFFIKVYLTGSRKITIDRLFLLGSVVILSADFFLPTSRYLYYDVQLLFPLALLLRSSQESQEPLINSLIIVVATCLHYIFVSSLTIIFLLGVIYFYLNRFSTINSHPK